MNNETLQRFLNGTASETEQRTCEALLSGNTPIVDDTLIDNDDPIVAALQQPKDPGSISSFECEIPQGISQMFPDISERSKRIREVLETSNHPEDLGAIGRYRIIELIGVGSSSWVFRAIDTSMEREVCIKLLQPDKGTSLEVRSRFAREAREVARMCSDRIMPVLELGNLSQTPYLVMPLLEGRSLRTLIEQEQRLPAERAQRLVKQIAEGLSHAHGLGVMHRDIKPENIWVTPSDDIKLLDFGLAHIRDDSTPITREGTVVGTPSYMSPEQVTGKPIDARSDLFSLGVVLVELLTGQSPFNKNNLFSTLMSVAGDPIDFAAIDPEQSISQPLRQLIVDLLHKAPDERIRSADLLIERLETLNRPITNPPSIGGGRIFKTIAAGLAGFALCAALLWMWDLSDKGTLVVETSDPNVQVAIAKEKVTVVDPVSKQSYEIKIGETKLPSGYYQLEAKLADGLAFSSDSITIRRGEKILVSVSLKPPVNASSASGGPAIDPKENKPGSIVAMESNSSLNKPWADPTRDPLAHDPATRQQVFDRVAALPSLPFKRSVQDSQPQISAIQDWWVDTAAGMLSIDSIPNCDQTLWLESQAGWVKVANRSGDKQLHIPTSDLVFKGRSMANWDTVNPNLLVVTSDSTDYSDTAESQKHPFLAQVWLLSQLEDCIQGRLIREYPCDTTNVMLDSGYRIVLVRDELLEIRRLDSDQVWAVAKNQSTPDPFVKLFNFGPNAISPEGRWLAATTSTPTQKSIFELQSGSMWLAVNSGQVLIGNGGRALVLNESFKLWDIARQTLEKEIPLDSKIAHSAEIAINPSATYAAYPTDSSVRIIDLKNSKQINWSPAWNCTVAGHLAKSRNTHSSRQSSLKGSSLRLGWRDDGNLLAFHRGETAIWNVDAEDTKATQVVIPDHNPVIGRMEIVGLQLHDDRELSIAWQAANGFQDRVSTARLSLPQLKLQKVMKLDGAYCIDVLQKARYSQQGKAISPDGRYLVVGAHPQTPETANRRSGKFLIELAQPDAVIAEFLDTNSPEKFSWSDDSKYLWAGNEIVDIEPRKNSVMNSDFSRAVPLGKHSVISVQHGEMLFHHSLETRAGKTIGNQLERTIGYRPSQVALAPTLPPLLFLKNDNNKSVGHETTLVRIREDLTFEVVGEGPFSPLDLISPNTSHLLRAIYPSNPGSSNDATVTWQIHRIHAKEERRLETEKVLDDLTRVAAYQWHPQNVSACWTSRDDKFLRFFDCATNRMQIRRLRSDLVIPFYSGWLIATEDRLIAVDKVGRPNAEMVFSWEGGQPKHAHWILPNGTVQSGVPLQGLFISSVEDNTVRTRPLEQVIESEPFKRVLSDQPMNFLK